MLHSEVCEFASSCLVYSLRNSTCACCTNFHELSHVSSGGQVSYYEGHQFAIQSNSIGAWSRPTEDGGQGGRQIKLQTFAACSESWGEDSFTFIYINCCIELMHLLTISWWIQDDRSMVNSFVVVVHSCKLCVLTARFSHFWMHIKSIDMLYHAIIGRYTWHR